MQNNQEKMKAWVLNDLGKICLEERDLPAVAEHEVLVEVKAAGICGSDIPRIYITGAYHYPLIPGHEFSGQVVRLGKHADSQWLGQRVGIFPLIPCQTCLPCQKKQYEMCRSYSYLGSRRDGGFAGFAAVPVSNLLALPENVSYEEAAMLEPMAVAVHAIRRLSPFRAEQADSAVICGMGTIGMLVLMFLLEAGVKQVFVLGNKDFQRKTAGKLGLSGENYCDIRSQNAEEWIAQKTGETGPELFFECVGKPETIRLAVDCTQPGGEIVLVGNPYSDIFLEKKLYWKILRNQLRLTGTWNSSFTHASGDDWHYVLERLAKKRISPETLITHRMPVEELEKGFQIMKNKEEDYCKILMTNPSSRCADPDEL